MESSEATPLDTSRHIRYWQRCYKSLLPHHYTSMDSTRLALGFFIIAALDLLSSSSSYSEPPSNPRDASLIPAIDRQRLRSFVLSLQHPLGGFCGSPNHVLPREWAVEWSNEQDSEVAGDPANPNIAATYFALLLLGLVAEGDGSDAYDGVHVAKTLAWLKHLQRSDGSFGDVVNEHGFVSGGRDMRFCLLAATIRHILGGDQTEGSAEDINVDALVAHIRRGQTFDGGISESATHESHAGYGYCAVAALSMLNLSEVRPKDYLKDGISSIPSLIHFLVSRQFLYLTPEKSSTDDIGDGDGGGDDEDSDPEDPTHILSDLSTLSLIDPFENPAGFNGRVNKKPDTCYTWWVAGTLAMLGESEAGIIDRDPARNFILEKTQHIIGGFGKHPGSPPDVYHGYLGLAALSTLAEGKGVREEGLGRLDPRFCLGVEAVERIARGRDGILARGRSDKDKISVGGLEESKNKGSEEVRQRLALAMERRQKQTA